MMHHSQACQNQWSMEIQVCICGAANANRELKARDAEIARLKAELATRT